VYEFLKEFFEKKRTRPQRRANERGGGCGEEKGFGEKESP
jgi:hypothetical protein